MIGFIRGNVHAFSSDYVLVDTGSVGYRINFYHPEILSIGKEVLIYTYQNVREDEISLYGFVSLNEYDLFVKLISVKGLGPKIASGILAFSNVDKIIEAIELGDLGFIKKMPGVGNKTASQIILDLKGKLVEASNKEVVEEKYKDVIEALKSMGYKSTEINPVIKRLKDENLSDSECLRKALGMLVK